MPKFPIGEAQGDLVSFNETSQIWERVVAGSDVVALDWKESCRAATTADVNIQTDLQPGQVQDGVVLAEDDRVLVRVQVDQTENGLYAVPALGGVVERTPDAVQGTLTAGAVTNITEGVTLKQTFWVQVTPDPITIGVSLIVWEQLALTPLCSDVPEAISAGSAGAAGTDVEAARCDHEHPVPTAAAATISDNTNAEGVSTSVARADHTHQLTTLAASVGDVPQWDGNDWVATAQVNGFNPSSISNGGTTTISSATDILITGMTLTPAAGSYTVFFWADTEIDAAAANAVISLYVDGVQMTNSEAVVDDVAGVEHPSMLMARVATVDGTEDIEARVRTSGGNSITFRDRRLMVVPED